METRHTEGSAARPAAVALSFHTQRQRGPANKHDTDHVTNSLSNLTLENRSAAIQREIRNARAMVFLDIGLEKDGLHRILRARGVRTGCTSGKNYVCASRHSRSFADGKPPGGVASLGRLELG